MSGDYGYFHDLFFVDGPHTAANCRLDVSRPPKTADGEPVYLAAGNAAGMLSTHLRRMSEVLHDAFDTDEPLPPSREAMRDITWSMGELSGLLDVMRRIEELGRETAGQSGK